MSADAEHEGNEPSEKRPLILDYETPSTRSGDERYSRLWLACVHVLLRAASVVVFFGAVAQFIEAAGERTTPDRIDGERIGLLWLAVSVILVDD